MFRSLVSPEPTVNSPPAICPDGILIPVLDSDESCRGCGVLLGSLVNMMQLAAPPHLFPFTLTLLSPRMMRIGGEGPASICSDPSMARKQWLATPRRSTCTGLSLR